MQKQVCALLAIVLLALPVRAVEGQWYAGFGVPGVEGQVFAAVEHDCALIVGGQFTALTPSGAVARNIARWDGVKWTQVGESLLSGQVRALLSHEGVLYAGGSFNFTNALGESVRRVAYFDGSNWRPMGEGLAGGSSVRALAAYGGEVVAGGFFTTSGAATVSRVARWDGGAWQPLGAGLDDVVHALEVHDGELYAGGQFTDTADGGAGGALGALARWDGAQWAPVGAGGVAGGFVFDLLSRPGAGDLIVAGSFTSAVGDPRALTRIASWSDAVGWAALDDGLNNDVLTLAEFGGLLFAGGRFSRADVAGLNIVASRAAYWNGFRWRQLGDGLSNAGAPGLPEVAAMAVFGPTLVAGGSFFIAGSTPANSVAQWDLEDWSALGRTRGPGSPSGSVRALASFDGELYAGGAFTFASGAEVNRIARFDGDAWHSLFDGLNDTVYALHGEQQHLYVGGAFDRQFLPGPDTFFRRAARWNGVFWSGLQDGPGESLSWHVFAITRWNGQIVVAGQFQSAGGQVVNQIAIWNGQTYEPIGSPPGMDGPVHALATYDGLLIAGGAFGTAGGAACANIASWDGKQWGPVGPGLGGEVNALLVHEGRLIAGGEFTTDGDGLETLRRIAAWDGAEWSAIDQGMNNEVDALCEYNGELVAAGRFTRAGGVDCNRIARVQGGLWRRLGVGLNDRGRALAAHGGDLYVGGDFTTAGGRPSPFLARWSESPFEDPLSVPTNGAASAIAVALLDEPAGSALAYADLAIANVDTGTVTIVRNLGADGQGEWLGFDPAPLSYGVDDAPIAITTTDWNGDGHPDVLVAHAGASNAVRVLLNDGAAGVMGESTVGVPGPASAIVALSRDDDKDLDDIAVAIPMFNVVVSAPVGASAATQIWAVGDGPSGLAGADYNQDGVIDLAVTNEHSGDLSLLLGLGFGQFAPEVRLPVTDLCLFPGPRAVQAGDINGDGLADLAIANRAADSVAVLLNSGFDSEGVWLGFDAPVTLAVGASPGSITAGDFGGSGLLDLVSANSAQDTLSYLRNTTGEEFDVPIDIDVSPGPVFVTTADFDLDGQLDLISASSGGSSRGQSAVEVRLNAGPGADAPACPGDASGDLVVNFTDLNSVLFNYGGAGEGLLGDLNGDGVIGFEDLNAVLVNFGTDCLPD